MALDPVAQVIVDHYLNSRDFNGLPASSLAVTEADRRSVVLELLKTVQAEAVFGDRHPNPHIKAFAAEPLEEQIRKVEAHEDLEHVCLYPTSNVLEAVVDPSRYPGRPFTLRLALGDGQLDFRAFDLTVLEHYRNDPRYFYRNDDISGWISVREAHYRSEAMRESDKVMLETFGFCYDPDLNRAVAVFLRYLSDLSPEHQQVWATKMLTGDYKLHPSYFDSSVLGVRPEGVPIFDAFVHEQHHINEMCELMAKPHLFREDFRGENKPRGFGFLIRPTAREFNDFMLLLDKMMSDNINVKFFERDIDREVVEERTDGTRVATLKGTITMLEEWLAQFFRVRDVARRDEMIATFRTVRKMRQSPAHAVRDDDFDQRYFREQREVMSKAYDAVLTIRLIFSSHPAVTKKGYKVPDWLAAGRIWTH